MGNKWFFSTPWRQAISIGAPGISTVLTSWDSSSPSLFPTSGFQFLQAKTEDEKVENGVDAVVGLFGLIPGVGTGISLYWTIEGKKVYWEYTVPRALAGEDVVTLF